MMGATPPATKSNAVNPGAVDQMGQALAYKPKPMYEGRGDSSAPMKGMTVHANGSQGKHK